MGDLQKTKTLIEVLQSNAGLFEKARACQQLGEFGTEDAVPALAALLGDEHLSAYARSGLEGIGTPAAAAALRSAAKHLNGKLLAGVVNSLGVLRDAESVNLLAQLAREPASGVVKEALSALGRIADDSAIVVLTNSLPVDSEDLRGAAVSGCLLATERQLKEGQSARALSLYEAILTSKAVQVPGYRLAAVHGAILAHESDRVPFLIEKLRSSDPIVRNAAFMAVREVSNRELADALNEELRQTKPELQGQLLLALADCHDQNSIALIEEKARTEDPELRKTALAVLGKIGNPSTVGFLLGTVLQNHSQDEVSIAINAIERMEGASVDDLIRKQLGSDMDAAGRVRLVQLVEARGITNANSELLNFAADNSPQVAIAAFEALKSRAGTTELPKLIALTSACADGSVRAAAEGAVYGACSTVGNPGANEVLAQLKQATKAVDKNSWVKVLVSLGYNKALPSIEGLVNDPDETVASNAIEQLGQWPSPAPVDLLLRVAENGANPQHRRLALDSVIRLARTAAEENQCSTEKILTWFDRANKDAGSVAEKRLIISGLGRLSHPDSLQLLMPFLDEPGLQAEAAAAVLQIAPSLAKQATGAPLRQALEKICVTTKNEQVCSQARKIEQTISEYKEVPLFDGLSLQGWEGDTNVWRVRDHVIVGGSMAGNPRNEFLATTRGYTNFLLRLEYKLVGTDGFINSGVQFHSVRVIQPPNEMCGYQADIGAGYSGCLYDESRRNKFLLHPPDEQIKRLERPSEWNRYEVRCEASHIQILLNGETTVDYQESDAAISHSGLIGLQIHGGCKAEVFFRNINIVEWPK